MSKVPADLKYTEDHQWLRTDANGVITIGITDYQQRHLGDIVNVEMYAVGTNIAAGDQAALVESVVFSIRCWTPVAGEIVEIDQELREAPEEINEDPYDAWIYKIKPSSPLTTVTLLDAAAYAKLVAGSEV